MTPDELLNLSDKWDACRKSPDETMPSLRAKAWDVACCFPLLAAEYRKLRAAVEGNLQGGADPADRAQPSPPSHQTWEKRREAAYEDGVADGKARERERIVNRIVAIFKERPITEGELMKQIVAVVRGPDQKRPRRAQLRKCGDGCPGCPICREESDAPPEREIDRKPKG